MERIKRIRQKFEIRGKQKRKFKVMTDSKPKVLGRNFAVAAPNQGGQCADGKFREYIEK